MKPFFFTLDIHHYRTGQLIGKCIGVVFADNIEQAEKIAWEKCGNENCCALSVREIDEDGASYTVWRWSF